MTTEPTRANDETQIRARIDAWAAAMRARDADGVLASCAPDIVSFDCHSQFRFKGADALRKHLEACFPCMQGPMTFDIHEFYVSVSGDAAFCHFLAWCVATGMDGTDHTCWLRGTSCLRRTKGKWLIVHDHCSVPFNPMNGQAMLDAEPENTERAREGIVNTLQNA